MNDVNRNYVIGGVVVLGVLGLFILMYYSMNPPEISGLQRDGRTENGHDDTIRIEFGELPPTNGTHNTVWQNCGIYDEPILPENAIHSMEHGAVWVTYQEDLPAREIAELKDLVRGEAYVLLSPYPNQRSPIVATAWGLQLEVDDAGDSRLTRFLDRYIRGLQTPEIEGVCDRGLGDPTG